MGGIRLALYRGVKRNLAILMLLASTGCARMMVLGVRPQTYPELIRNGTFSLYFQYCPLIDPYDSEVRRFTAEATTDHAAIPALEQAFDIFDHMRDRIAYRPGPGRTVPGRAAQTIDAGSGDCKNQSVVAASALESVGMRAGVVVAPECGHAYAMLLLGSEGAARAAAEAVGDHYGLVHDPVYFSRVDGRYWLIFDTTTEYPGAMNATCLRQRGELVMSCRSIDEAPIFR